MVQRATPPFRADHVGSLLRTALLKEARSKHAKGEIDAAALKAVEDREIERVIKKQEEIGLKAITDGEFRRYFFHTDFLLQLAGVEPNAVTPGTLIDQNFLKAAFFKRLAALRAPHERGLLGGLLCFGLLLGFYFGQELAFFLDEVFVFLRLLALVPFVRHDDLLDLPMDLKPKLS